MVGESYRVEIFLSVLIKTSQLVVVGKDEYVVRRCISNLAMVGGEVADEKEENAPA